MLPIDVACNDLRNGRGNSARSVIAARRKASGNGKCFAPAKRCCSTKKS